MKFEFPVKLHKFTTEEFDRKKAEYVAKYGYTMNIPGLKDIVKLDIPRPPTEQELAQYKSKDVKTLGVKRYDEIWKHMQKKKESFLRMMGSPTPTWINNIGTTMTLLDDINDASGTLSVLCRTAAHLLPKTVAKAFMGPAGWALLAADIANVAMTVMRAPISVVGAKNDLSKASTTNPFCKEARVTRSKRLKRIKPSKGEIIEGLQTTNNVFGIGLSLGPILGAVIEAVTGPYRVLTGKKVQVKWPWPDLAQYQYSGYRALTAGQQLMQGGQELSDEDHTRIYVVLNMATQVLNQAFEEYHPLDQVEGIENIELTARRPTDPSTKLIFEEEGIDYTKHIGFLYADRDQLPATELMDIGFDHNLDSFTEYAENTKHTHLGWLGAQCVNDFAQNSLSLWEDEDQVELDIHPVEKSCFKIMDNQDSFDETVTSENLELFADQVMSYHSRGVEPSFSMIRDEICPAARATLERRPVGGFPPTLAEPIPLRVR